MSALAEQENDVFESFSNVSQELVANKDWLREINIYLAEKHKVILGTFEELLNNQDKLQHLSKEELIVILNAVHVVTKDERISPSIFFSEKEIKQALKFKEIKEEATFPHTFEGTMLRNEDGTFSGTITYQELLKLWNGGNGILTYNYDTQRAPKKKLMAKGNIKKSPTVVNKSVKNIARLVSEGKFVRTQLIFNILANGNDNFYYDDGELTIEEGTELNIMDGMHRLMGVGEALEVNPNIDGSFDVSIRNKRLDDARYELGIINHVNRFDKTLVKFNTDSSYGALVTKELIRIPELRDRVETDKTTVSKTLNMLTNYAILADSVNITFDPQNTKEQYLITDFLKKFYGILISSYTEDFKTDMKKRRSVSHFNHHNMHVGFLVIAKKIYDKYEGSLDFPVSLVNQAIEKIDYTKGSGNKLDKIMIEQGNRNSNQSKALIRTYFEEEMNGFFE